MPSGDSMACAFFCSVYMYIFDCPLVLIIFLPMVCLGRVYVQCHWFSDTVAGSALGLVY